MSVLSRVSAPAVNHELANVVAALLSSGQRPATKDLLQPTADQVWGRDSQPAASLLERLVTGPTGLGTSAVRFLRPGTAAETRTPTSDESSELELYCPPGVRDDRALSEEVNDRLVDWAKQVGIYPGSSTGCTKPTSGA